MRRNGYLSITACCTAALALLDADRVTAQNTCWRVTDVTALNGQPNDDKVPGINAAGEVVGSFKVGVKWHAFVWLPVANPNYPALSVGLNDLHVLAGLDDQDQSAARSINDAGQVAGQVGFNLTINNGRAIVLDLTQPVVSVIDVPVPTENASGARAINNANPFQVVGHFGSTDICQEDEQGLFRGFIWESGAANVTVLRDTALTDHSFALGVNTPAAGNAALITGREEECFLVPPCPAFHTRQIAWDKKNPNNTVPLVDPTGFVDSRGTARDANLAEQLVGWGTVHAGGFTCRDRAVLWETPASPIDLHTDVTPPLPLDEQSHANGMNDLSPPQIVGSNTFTNLALLWEKVGGSWTVTSLTDVLGRCSVSNWTILRAHDINDSGWIVAWAQLGNQHHVVLLTPGADCPPTTCNADISGPANGPPDGMIGINDFLTLLADWGPCPPLAGPCRSDLDCDGIVGITDFLELLGLWGPCGAPSGEVPQTVEDCIARFGLETALLTKCICTVEPESCETQ